MTNQNGGFNFQSFLQNAIQNNPQVQQNLQQNPQMQNYLQVLMGVMHRGANKWREIFVKVWVLRLNKVYSRPNRLFSKCLEEECLFNVFSLIYI